MTQQLDLELFKNPPRHYRGVPFFSVNDKLESSKLVEYAVKMVEAGFGGVFFHAREGLATPFLGEEWFSAFKTLAEVFRDLGLNLWIYDEDRWPSGFASGLLPSKGARYRAKAVVLVVDNKGYVGEELLALFRCRLDENDMPVECTRVSRPGAESGYVYLSFFKYTAPIGDPWFQGFSYADLLDSEVVKEFIRVAYEPYAERFKEHLGRVVVGVFIDEPNIHDSRPRFPHWWKKIPIPPRGMGYPVYAIPWTDTFGEYFRKVNGYDVVEKLPELFFDIGNYVKTRYDYWKTLTKLFVESFTKSLYEWCDKRGLKLTGHFLAEDNLLVQISVGSVMPHYEYMHIPGIDHLGYQVWNSLLTAKQVSSVAEQLGKERVLCETYGELGYFASFEDRKWIGDFLYALGVNMLNHHLLPYSLRGRRKADYGLFFHPSQPWWKYNKIMEDYFARLSYVLSLGKRVVEVLVLHPMGSVWSTYSPVNDGEVKRINGKYFEVLKTLVRNHVDFELGDELIMEKYGRVEDGFLIVGRSRYKIAIMPPMINISSRVLSVLAEFAKTGVVVVVESLPEYVDGTKSNLPSDLLERVVVAKDPEDLAKKLTEYKRDFTLVVETDKPTEDILYHARVVGNSLVVFVTNVSRVNTHTVKIGVKGEFEVKSWDPFTGNAEAVPARVVEGRTWVEFTLKPTRSQLYVLSPGKPISEEKTVKSSCSLVEALDLAGEWRVELLDKNNLVLDYARVWIPEKQSWTTPIPLPKVKDDFLSTSMGKAFRLKFEFYVESVPENLEVVIEYSKSIKKLLVNNYEVDLEKPSGTWLDWNFRSYEVPGGILKRGLNEVVIEVVPSLEPELEPIYLRGRFGVDLREGGKKPVIVEPISVVRVDKGFDLTKCGYPFYAGEVALSREFDVLGDFDKASFIVSDLNASLAVLEVNGIVVDYIIHRDVEVDVTKFLKRGKNTLKLTLIGTLRNLLGPLHKEYKSSIYPELFYVVDASWRDEYLLAPFGFGSIKLELFKLS